MKDPVVISSRIRLARNLRDYPFPCRMDDKQRTEVAEKVREALKNCDEKFMFVSMEDVNELDAVAMVERHLISPEFANSKAGRALAVTEDESISIMINEEDHLRIQVIKPGMSLREAYAIADRIDTELDKTLHFAFDNTLGFLTQCPTNLGTGMRASVMMHLCALADSRAVSRIASNLSKLGLAVRGTYGEGTDVSCALYQLSNQVTLGISEKSAIENLQNICTQLASSELQSRETLMQSMEYQDKISRSMGILLTARLISHAEAMKLLSNVRLGITEGIIDDVTIDAVDELMASIHPASLMRAQQRKLSPQERDKARAELIKATLR
ncbi:MAG: protein arginine kinase [Clostridia bacterium]|nr:protein arginine kinase [Clostridia bacterium]